MDMVGFLNSMQAVDPRTFRDCLSVLANDIDGPTHEVLAEVVAAYPAIFPCGPEPRSRLDILEAIAGGIYQLAEKARSGELG